MNNKQSLLNLVARAERGVLLPGEAQILRDAIELLDDMAMCLDKISSLGRITEEEGGAIHHPDYEASTTQTFRALTPGQIKAVPRPAFLEPKGDDVA